MRTSVDQVAQEDIRLYNIFQYLSLKRIGEHVLLDAPSGEGDARSTDVGRNDDGLGSKIYLSSR